MAIDQRIDDFNAVIREAVGHLGGQWQVVDIGAVLDTLAVKRNNRSDAPGLPLVDYYTAKGRPDHPLLQLKPVPNVLRFDTQNATRLQGGLFSLDCIHPTTIGYGIVAEEFLAALQSAGIAGADPLNVDWPALIAQDTLIQSPPKLWDDILAAAEKNAIIWDLLLSFMS
jgi:phospholipase/lecithinase/hemolysin